MKIKTQDLLAEDRTLDWAVAKCVGVPVQLPHLSREYWDKGETEFYRPSTNEAEANYIIDRFNKEQATASSDRLMISTGRGGSYEHNFWRASIGFSGERMYGPTRSVAALRCYVNFKLGPEVEVPDELVPHLVAQHAAKKDSAPPPSKRADPDITNKWDHVQTYGNYVDFDKELYSLPDEGNTSVDMRMSFDTEDHTCYYTIKLHNDDCETRDWEKEHHIPWSVGVAMLVADGVEVPAVLMAQSAQEGPGDADDSATAHQPIDRPRG